MSELRMMRLYLLIGEEGMRLALNWRTLYVKNDVRNGRNRRQGGLRKIELRRDVYRDARERERGREEERNRKIERWEDIDI